MFNTLLVTLEQTLLYVTLVVGGYISISLMKVPDLSLESAFIFGATCAYKIMPLCSGLPQPIVLVLTLIAALIGGGCVGFMSSFLTTELKLPHLLSTIITIGLFNGISLFLLGASNISLYLYKNVLETSFCGPLHPELFTFICIGILMILFLLYLLKTQLGYCFGIYGKNSTFFNHHSINGTYIFKVGIIIANACAGLSGYMVAQSNNFVDITMGCGIPLLAITSLILGKTVIRYSKLQAIVPLIGTLFYLLLQQVLLKTGFDLKFFSSFQALIVLTVLVAHYSFNPSESIDHLGV